jgi:hypothetical protein
VIMEFEKWASSKGFNLEREHIVWPPYQDPITRAAFEGYQQGCSDEGFFWKPMYMHAASIIRKHGLWEESKDYSLEKALERQTQELATRSKP